MRVVVCAKQVPDPGAAPPPALDTSWLVPVDAPILDDADLYGIELGLQLTQGEGTVLLVGMGSAGGDEGIRRGLAMGADEAVLIQDDPDHGSDALSTARALSAVAAEEPFDLVITGTASADGSTGVMCQLVGELLGVPTVADVTRAEVQDGVLTVHRQTPDGYDVVSCRLPAVISVTAGAVEPRYPNVKGVIGSKRKRIARRQLAEVLGGGPDTERTAPRVAAIVPADTRDAGRQIEDDGEAHLAILSILEERGII